MAARHEHYRKWPGGRVVPFPGSHADHETAQVHQLIRPHLHLTADELREAQARRRQEFIDAWMIRLVVFLLVMFWTAVIVVGVHEL